MTRIFNIIKKDKNDLEKKNREIKESSLVNSRFNLMKANEIKKAKKIKGKIINREKTNKEAKEAKDKKEVKEKAKKTNKEANEAEEIEKIAKEIEKKNKKTNKEAKEKAKKTNKEAKEKAKKAKEEKKKAKEKAKEEEKKNKKDAKDLKNEINSFYKEKNYIKKYQKIGFVDYYKTCHDFLKKIKDSKLDEKSKSKLEKIIRIKRNFPLQYEINSLYKKQNYKEVLRNTNFIEFQKKCMLYLKINLKINKDKKLTKKIEKIYEYAFDDNNYHKIHLDYEDEPIEDIIYHIYDKFKIEDYSIKNINKVQKNLMNKFKLPIFRKYIREDFKKLKDRIKLENYRNFFNKKSIENKRNNLKELKKDIKNNDLLDNNEGGVGINEQLRQNPLNDNIEDDKIPKRKKKVLKDNHNQQKLSF